MATAEITVAVEKVVHDALRELAEAVWDKHGICVRSVRFSWVKVSAVTDPRQLLTDVEVETLTMAKSRGEPVIPQPSAERRNS